MKLLREYEAMGLIYTVGRTAGNYRLFDDEALWCVNVVGVLRSLGLTLAEIQQFAVRYLQRSDEPIGPRLASLLDAARARTKARIAELQDVLQRIDRFETSHHAELRGEADFRSQDPRAKTGA